MTVVEGPVRITRSDLPNPIDPRDPRTPTLADVSADDIVLVGHDATLALKGRVTNVKPNRTIDGASTIVITVSDPDLKILNSPAIKGTGDGNLYSLAIVDSLVFQLVGISTRPRQTTLTMEPEVIHRLRREIGAYSLRRSTVTRAQFILQLCEMAGVELYCPELNTRQQIQTVAQAETQAQKDRKRAPGFRKGVALNVKGKRATRAQLDEASRLLGVAVADKAPYAAQLALIFAAIAETGLGGEPGSYKPNNLGYWGVLQGGSGQNGSAPNFKDPHDTEAFAHYFLHGGKGFNAGGALTLVAAGVTDPAEIAVKVEAPSVWPDNAYARETGYAQFRPEAVAILAAFNGGATNTETYAKPYQFKRLKHEDSWTCMRRLADEVGWHLFECAGTVYFMSPAHLKQSRPRMLVAPNADGIDEVNVDYDTSPKADNQIRVICHAAQWAAPPGSVAEVQGYGPVDGRWLVHDIARDSLASTRTTVTLSRFHRKLLEPAHDTGTRTPNASTATTKITTPSSASGLRAAIVTIAKASMTVNTGFSRYSQPGALTSDVTPPSPARTDCSQWIRACYLQAGGPDPGVNTFQMAEKGIKTTKPQPGDIMLTKTLGHCELYIGDGKTIGHGSAAIDYGPPLDYWDRYGGHFFVTFKQLG